MLMFLFHLCWSKRYSSCTYRRGLLRCSFGPVSYTHLKLYAQVGFTGTDNEFNSAYRRLKDNQIVEIGFKIPILDWGKRRGQVKIAQSNRDVTESKLRQETMIFNQNPFILVEQFNNQQAQLQIADDADKIAQKRYSTNVETFMVGKRCV